MPTRLTQEQLQKLFLYNEVLGKLFRRGTIRKTGTRLSNGYIKICINYEQYYAHQLIWTLVKGEPWPDNIDHINQITDDNRIHNMRKSTSSQNLMNSGIKMDNTSGFRGVSFCHFKRKWRARVKKDGREFVSYHETIEEAALARDRRARTLYGEFIP